MKVRVGARLGERDAIRSFRGVPVASRRAGAQATSSGPGVALASRSSRESASQSGRELVSAHPIVCSAPAFASGARDLGIDPGVES